MEGATLALCRRCENGSFHKCYVSSVPFGFPLPVWQHKVLNIRKNIYNFTSSFVRVWWNLVFHTQGRTLRRGEYVALRWKWRQQEVWENNKIMSFIICTLTTSVVRAIKSGRMRWQARGRWEMYTNVWSLNLKGRDHFIYIYINWRIMLKWILNKWFVNWIELAHDRPFVKMEVIFLGLLKWGTVLTSCASISCWGNSSWIWLLN